MDKEEIIDGITVTTFEDGSRLFESFNPGRLLNLGETYDEYKGRQRVIRKYEKNRIRFMNNELKKANEILQNRGK